MLVDAGRIQSIDAGEQLLCPAGARRLDATGFVLAPGFIDLQVNGACVQAHRGAVRIGPRPEFGAEPRGDLLQAGPLLVQGGRPVYADGEDREGFSAAAHQFDSTSPRRAGRAVSTALVFDARR